MLEDPDEEGLVDLEIVFQLFLFCCTEAGYGSVSCGFRCCVVSLSGLRPFENTCDILGAEHGCSSSNKQYLRPSILGRQTFVTSTAVPHFHRAIRVCPSKEIERNTALQASWSH